MTSTPERAPSRSGAQTQPLTAQLVRLLVELASLAALAWWGWKLGDGGTAGIALALLFIFFAAALRGALGTPGDPARTAQPWITVPGWLRLALELVILGLAAFAIWITVSRAASETFLTVAGVLYVVTWDRQLWLLRH